jgi:aminopeptidase N
MLGQHILDSVYYPDDMGFHFDGISYEEAVAVLKHLAQLPGDQSDAIRAIDELQQRWIERQRLSNMSA